MYYIYAGHNPEYSFIKRPFEQIIKEIKSVVGVGKDTIVFSNSAETLDIHIRKIQRVVEYFSTHPIKFILLTGSVDGQQIYDELFNLFQWKNKIDVRCAYMFELGAAKQLRSISGINYIAQKKEKLFLSFNRRTTLHRFYLLNFILDSDLLDKCFLSFEGVELQYFLNRLHPEYKSHKNLINILKKLPIRLNITKERSNPAECRVEDKEYFDNSYFSVVTETYFSNKLYPHQHSYKFFSEKVFKPIVFKHPFILMGWPGALQELKNLGYKTFSPYIDETYDSIEDDFQRYEAITKEIIRLSKQTDTEWIDWQHNIRDVVEYNNTILLSKLEKYHA